MTNLYENVNCVSRISESLPNITGEWGGAEQFTVTQLGTGAITWVARSGRYSGGYGGAGGAGFTFSANTSSKVYQNNAHVTPLSYACMYYIRFK